LPPDWSHSKYNESVGDWLLFIRVIVRNVHVQGEDESWWAFWVSWPSPCSEWASPSWFISWLLVTSPFVFCSEILSKSGCTLLLTVLFPLVGSGRCQRYFQSLLGCCHFLCCLWQIFHGSLVCTFPYWVLISFPLFLVSLFQLNCHEITVHTVIIFWVIFCSTVIIVITKRIHFYVIILVIITSYHFLNQFCCIFYNIIFLVIFITSTLLLLFW
jgi:hypothetical protein